MNPSVGELRLRLCDAATFPEADRHHHVTAPIAGMLLGHLWSESELAEQLVSTPLLASEAKALGLDAKAAIAAALANVANRNVPGLDVMRISDETRLFIYHDDDPALVGRLVDVEALVDLHLAKLSPGAKRHAVLGAHGALVGVPTHGLLMVLAVDANNLMEGAVNLAANVRANHDQDAEDALSPWLYWVKGNHIEEMKYDVEDDDVSSIAFPNELLPLLQ